MKTVSFTGKGVKILHIETEGCIVNITINLSNDKGESVTHIEVLPDRYCGEEWRLAENSPHNIRVIEGKE